MKTETAPTSPKYRVEKLKNEAAKAMDAVWKDEAAIQPPRPVPWGRMIIITSLVTIAVMIGLLWGWRWAANAYPHSLPGRWWPQGTKSTIIQTAKETTTDTPAAVTKSAARMIGLARDLGKNGRYTDDALIGSAVPLSTSGWFLTSQAATVSGSVVLPLVGQPSAITTKVVDPASDAVFGKVESLGDQPIEFGVIDLTNGPQRVWLVSYRLAQPQIISRQIVHERPPRWVDSDRWATRIILDQPADVPAGTAILDRSGQLIGWTGANGSVTPASVIEPIVSLVIKEGTIQRPMIGLHTLDLNAAIIAGQPTAHGFLVGNNEPEPSVVAKGPADKAGIKSGDTITQVEKKAVNGDLFSIVQRYAPGEILTLTVVRNSKAYQAVITVGRLTP